jgi:hypothetical protein
MKWFDLALAGAAIAFAQPTAAAESPKNFVVHEAAKPLAGNPVRRRRWPPQKSCRFPRQGRAAQRVGNMVRPLST